VNIDPHKQRWLLTCEQLALEHLREACWCGGECHNLYAESTSVWSLCMYQYIREVLLNWPHLALGKRGLSALQTDDRPTTVELKYRSPLEAAVEMRRGSEYEIPHRFMISQLLGAGSDPNQVHVRSDSRHSIWGSFVARWWHVAHGNIEMQETRAFIEVAILLIRHGAYTWYPTCTTAHTIGWLLPNKLCRWTDFKNVVKKCVPADQQHELMQIVTGYSEESRRCHTNRKQKLLAFRSLRTSLVHELVREQLPSTYSLGDMLRESNFISPALRDSLSNWIGFPLKPPECSRHDHSRPTKFQNAYVCLDCAGFPTICKESLDLDPQAHTKHYVLLMSGSWKSLDNVDDIFDQAEYSESRPKDCSKRLLDPWELLLESRNRWFEARAEDGGVAMAESPTTENSFGHPFIPMAPKIELPSLNALTSNGEDEKDLPRCVWL
jgi:hypothetical protein